MMNRKIILFFLAALCVGKAQSQTHRDSLKAMYDSLPSHYYPSKILHNRSPLYRWSMDPNFKASPYNFPGSIPAGLIKKGWWNTLVSDMRESSIDTGIIPDGKDFRSIDSTARSIYDVPIAALHLDFHRIIPGAVDSGYLWYDTTANYLSLMPDTLWIDRDNGVYQIINNVDSLAQLAFNQHEVFAGALTNSAIYKQGTNFSITFGLVSSLFIENKNQQVSSVEMDFDNGEGFQPIQFDVAKTVNYDASVWNETYERNLRLRLHYGSKTVETRMPLTIVPNTQPADTVFFASDLPLECNIPTNGFVPDQAKISIRYGNPAKKLMKPVFLIEGFESALRDYGDITFESLSRGYVTNEAGERIFTQAALLKNAFDSLNFLGYDIVYIDNRNARDYIQANALNAIKTLQWINRELSANGSYEKPVVIGASMGGLVARYTLSKMEADGCCHNVRLYCTFDSPHNGANIPLGLQAAVKSLRDEFLWIDEMFFDGEKISPNWDRSLNSPGARQMLAVHIASDSYVERNSFMAEFDSLGQPQQCRQIAIVNGSEQALTNTISHPDKQYLKGKLLIPLPHWHWTGTGIVPILANTLGQPAGFPLLYFAANAESNPSNIIFKNNKMGLSSKLAAIIASIHGLSASLQILAKALSYIPLLTSYCYAAIVVIQTYTNVKLPLLHLTNLIFTTSINSVATPANMPNYSEAPGSTNNTPKAIANSLNGFGLDIVDLTTPTHSFIPSVSALDLDTNDLYLNIENWSQASTFKPPFDTYWAPGRGENPDTNMEHIRVTKDLYHWMIEQIDLNDVLRDSSGAYQAKLDGYYNFGRPSDFERPFLKHLHSVDVVDGGELYINRNGVIGFPGGSQYTTNNSSFSCFAGVGCDTTVVRIQAGGLFEIGQNATSNFGHMYFQEGSKLVIQDGGTLRINKQSNLVIEPGSELIIHPGAVIILVDSNSVLELQGRLILKQDAVFSPEGEGFVRFNQTGLLPIDWPNLLTYEANTQMHFTGNSMNDKRVEVRRNTPIFDDLDSLIFTNCRVEMAEDVFMAVHSSMSSTGSHFTSIDPQLPAMGMRFYGQEYVHIDQSRFSHCQMGINANLLTYGHPLAIAASKFDYNDVGLKVVGKNFTVNQCEFFDNTIGLEGQNIDGVSQVVNGDFRNNTQDGISVVGQHGSALRVSESHIEHSDKGVSATGTSLQVWCNTWDDNDIGIFAEEGEILMGRPQGHNNYFHNNRMDLHFYELDRLRFREGFNSLSGWYRYMTGSFSGNATNYLHYNNLTSGYELDVKNNDLPAISGFVPISLFLNSQQVVIHNWGPLSLVSTLCSQSSPSISGLTDCCFKTSFNVNVTGLGTLPLDSAILSAVGYLDNDQMTTINYLKDIIEYVDNNNYCYPEMSECSGEVMEDLDILVLRDAYQFYLVALSNAYRHGHIELNRAEPEGPLSSYLSFIIDETDYRIEHEVPLAAEPGDLEFYYNLSKAHAYRMGEHYDEALSILNDESLWHSTREIEQAAYWSCVCEAEKDLILEELSPDDFSYALEACRNHISQKKSRSIPDFGGIDVRHLLAKQAWSAEILPNPSNGFSELHFSSPTTGRGDYEIMATSGTRVASGSIPKGVKSIPLKLTLPAGLYTLRITMSDHDTRSLKWVVR